MTIETIREMHKEKISGGYISLLRVTLGLSFFTTWLSNISKGVFTDPDEYKGTINYFIDHADHISTPVDTFIREVIYEDSLIWFFIIGWFIVEGFIGLSLIFGFFNRFGSAMGAFFTVFLFLGALGVDWEWTYILLIVGFITCGWSRAGRWYGVDYWLQEKIPPKLAKILI
ncbi:MAG: TQO small subunit DoxD [Candidatus Hodarchaeota archaeon]